MAVRLTSLLVSGPILIPLSSGRTVRLSPGQSSDDLPDVEVADNTKVDKLWRRGVLGIETIGGSPGEQGESLVAGSAVGGEGAEGDPSNQSNQGAGGAGAR